MALLAQLCPCLLLLLVHSKEGLASAWQSTATGTFRWNIYERQPGCFIRQYEDGLTGIQGDDARPRILSILEGYTPLECGQECLALESCAGYSFTPEGVLYHRTGICGLLQAVPEHESDLVLVCQETPDPPPNFIYKPLGMGEETFEYYYEYNP